MKDKKGFTLVELLAVIAILAILVLIAIPNVLNLYRNARKNVFVSDVQNIVRTAQQKYIVDSMNNESNLCYDSKTNPLEIEAKSSLNYKIELSQNGKITSIQVLDNNYQLIKTNETDIKRDTIKSNEVNSRDKSQGLTDCKGNSIVEGTTTEPEPEQGIQYDSMLKSTFDEEKDGIATLFLNTPLNRTEIENINFVTTNEVPVGVDGYADVSDDGKGNIMMWWTENDNGNYDVTIGGQGGVKANTDSSNLFSKMILLTEINLENLDTSEVIDMYAMFSACVSLESITFGKNFDTSKVETMSHMFDLFSSLATLDLSSFNTSSLKDIDYMFYQSESISKIDMRNFDFSNIEENGFLDAFEGTAYSSTNLEIIVKSDVEKNWIIENISDLGLDSVENYTIKTVSEL